MSTRENTQADQVLSLLNQKGGSLKRGQILSALDVSESRLDNLLGEMVQQGLLERDPDTRGLYKVVTKSDTSVSVPAKQQGIDKDLVDLFSEDVELDVYTEIRVEAGDGRVVYPDEARKKITVPRQFISKIIGFIPPREVGMMMVDGDSMHPTIQEDDMVLWRPVEEIRGSGIYVLSVDGKLRCKRVDSIPGGGFRLISDNDYHGYPDYTLVPENGHLVNKETGSPVELYPVGKVIFPRRDTDRMHVKQVAEIVKSVAGADLDMKSMKQ